ncbi:MAG: glycosyltransferase family 39 protein [Verrucomicrobiota bacterium]
MKQVVWLALGLLLFRSLFLALSPLELSGDESYYWDWGRQLDWGYYSKPPLIAWLMGAVSQLLGSTTWGVRMGSALLGSASLLVYFGLARSLFGGKIATAGLLAIAVLPGATAASILLTIDAPLLFFWGLGLWAFWESLQAQGAPKWGWRGLLGVAMGLGLLTKQMMMALPLLGMVYLAISPEHRREFRSPSLWLALLLGGLLYLPNLLWNQANGWIMAQHTSEHFRGSGFDFYTFLKRLGDFLGGQAGLLSPIFWVLALWMGVDTLRNRDLLRQNPAFRFAWLASVLPVLAIALLLFQRRINANWPAVFYATLALTLTAWVLLRGKKGPLRWFRRGWWVALGLTLGVHIAVLALEILPADQRPKPVQRVSGWQELAAQVESRRRELNPEGDALLITFGHRYRASQLAFYLPDQPRVYRWPDRGIESQYEIWGGPDLPHEGEVLFLYPTDAEGVPPSLATHVEEILGQRSHECPTCAIPSFTLVHARGLREWPQTSAHE